MTEVIVHLITLPHIHLLISMLVQTYVCKGCRAASEDG